MEEVSRKVQHVYQTEGLFLVDELLSILKHEDPEALVTVEYMDNSTSIMTVEFWETVPPMTKLVEANHEEDDIRTIETWGGGVIFKDSLGGRVAL